MRRFLFDACISWQVAKALELVDVRAVHVTHVKCLGAAAPDCDIVRWCENENAVWVTADLKASKRSSIQAIPALACISIAFFRPPSSGWTRREWLLQFLKRVDRIEKIYETRHPVWYRFTSRGIERVPVPAGQQVHRPG